MTTTADAAHMIPSSPHRSIQASVTYLREQAQSSSSSAAVVAREALGIASRIDTSTADAWCDGGVVGAALSLLVAPPGAAAVHPHACLAASAVLVNVLNGASRPGAAGAAAMRVLSAPELLVVLETRGVLPSDVVTEPDAGSVENDVHSPRGACCTLLGVVLARAEQHVGMRALAQHMDTCPARGAILEMASDAALFGDLLEWIRADTSAASVAPCWVLWACSRVRPRETWRTLLTQRAEQVVEVLKALAQRLLATQGSSVAALAGRCSDHLAVLSSALVDPFFRERAVPGVEDEAQLMVLWAELPALLMVLSIQAWSASGSSSSLATVAPKLRQVSEAVRARPAFGHMVLPLMPEILHTVPALAAQCPEAASALLDLVASAVRARPGAALAAVPDAFVARALRRIVRGEVAATGQSIAGDALRRLEAAGGGGWCVQRSASDLVVSLAAAAEGTQQRLESIMAALASMRDSWLIDARHDLLAALDAAHSSALGRVPRCGARLVTVLRQTAALLATLGDARAASVSEEELEWACANAVVCLTRAEFGAKHLLEKTRRVAVLALRLLGEWWAGALGVEHVPPGARKLLAELAAGEEPAGEEAVGEEAAVWRRAVLVRRAVDPSYCAGCDGTFGGTKWWCGGCKLHAYCSPGCARVHWRMVHSVSCRRGKARAPE